MKHGKRENNETAGLFAVNASTGLLGQAKCYKDKLSYEFKCGSTPKKNLAPYKTKIELARKNIDLYKTNRQLVGALQNERKAHKGTLNRLNLQLASTNSRKRKRASAGTFGQLNSFQGRKKTKTHPSQRNTPNKKKAAANKNKI